MGFLTDLVSTAGRNAFVTMKGPVVRHHWMSFADPEQPRAVALRAAARGEETYFALGAFDPQAKLTFREGRTAANVVALRSFWLDVDAGEAKWEAANERKRKLLYPTFEAALEGIRSALLASGIVKPTHIVSSGNGVHLYWALTDDLPPDLWLKGADRLSSVLSYHGLRIDPSRSRDPASILRPIGTLHQAASEAAGEDVHVKLLRRRDPLTIEELVASLKAAPYVPQKAPRPERKAPTSHPAAKPTQKMGRTITAEQIAASASRATRPPPADTPENRAKLQTLLEHVSSDCGYDEWCRVIWAVQSLVDAGWDKLFTFSLLHEWSEAGASDDKWEDAFVKVLRSNDRGYHAKKIGIGSLVAIAEGNGMPDGFHFDEPGTSTAGRKARVTSSDDGVLEVEYATPEMPKNFFRKKDELGIWTRVKVDDGAEDSDEADGGSWEDHKFLGCDLHIVDRSVDGDGTEMLTCRIQFRKESKAKTIFIPAGLVYAGDSHETQKAFGSKGILPIGGKKGWALTVKYLQEQARLMMAEKDATRSIDSFGWQDDGSFVQGKVAYTADGTTVPVVPSPDIISYAEDLHPLGTLDAWKEVAELYAYEGLEFAQFPLLLSMGAPLHRHNGVTGGTCNLYSQEGGTGKSTLLQIAMSVWGNPRSRNGLVAGMGTGNSMFLKMGHMGSLPCMFDEVTRRGGPSLEILRDFVLRSTEGRGKDRMRSGTNQLRVNTTVWHTFAMMTSNRSMNALIGGGEDSSHAEQRRALDIQFDSLGSLTSSLYSVEHADRVLGVVLPNNYGTAGHLLARHYAANEEAMKQLVADKRTLLGDACMSRGMRDVQTFQISLMAIALAARDVAEELGIVVYDRKRMEQFCFEQLGEQQQVLREGTVGGEDIFNSFLRHNASRVLYTKKMGGRVVLCGQQNYPRDAVVGRWEEDTGLFSVVRAELRKFCSENRFDIRNVERWLETIQAMVNENETVMLSRGLVGYNSGMAKCYVIDAAKVGLVPPEEPNEGEQT